MITEGYLKSMNQDNPTYTDLLVQHANILLRNSQAHISGDRDTQDTYELNYLCVNLIEHFQRIKRLKISNSIVDELITDYSFFLEDNKYNLIVNGLSGAEPESCLSLFENAMVAIQWSLEKEEEPEFDFELYDQLTDCLVKRDDMFLLENFVRAHLSDFEKEEETAVKQSFDIFINALSRIDKTFKENIEVLALTDKFCRDYTKANSLLDENVYWWFYEPIYKAEEIGAISLMSLKSFFDNKKVNDNVVDIAADLNATVQFHRLMVDDKRNETEKVDNIYNLQEPRVENIHEQSAEYPLAAMSASRSNLSNGIYVLVVNSKSKMPEVHWLKSTLDVPQESRQYFNEVIIKIVNDTVPRIAQGTFKIHKRIFSIDLQTSTEGCAGKSIGLSILLEYLRLTGYLERDDLLIAATGELEIGGGILRVGDIQAKAQKAIECGFQIILVPSANKSDLSEEIKGNPTIKYVSNVQEAELLIRNYGKKEEETSDQSLKELSRISSISKQKQYEVSEIGRREWQDSITITSYGDKVKIIIDRKRTGEIGKPRLQGNPKSRIYREISELLNTEIEKVNESIIAHKSKISLKILNPETRERLRAFLKTMFTDEIQEKPEQNCLYRYDIGGERKVILKQYLNGTLVVDGYISTNWNKIVDSIETITKQKVINTQQREVGNGSDAKIKIVELPPDVTTWIGVDEAGKGDYYGPLVTAAVFVDPSAISKLSSIGIKDSKDLSDQKNIELGSLIQEICGDKCYVLTTMPEKYNELISSPSFKGNSQRLLGWQHRRAIENILLKYECEHAICDQFGSEFFINEGLKTGKGSKINIIQRPKAESNLAVAAASILARREFLLRLQKMNTEYGLTFPKGASDTKAIVNIAQALIKQYGKDILAKVAKVHFRTTKMIIDALSKK